MRSAKKSLAVLIRFRKQQVLEHLGRVPAREFTPEERRALDAYLDEADKVVTLLDPLLKGKKYNGSKEPFEGA